MGDDSINRKRRGWMASLAACGLAACRPVSMLNALIPAGHMHIQRDIAFGVLPRQRLDIYRPAAPLAESLPVVMFFYGGSWDSGSKQDYLFVAEALTSRGYLVVIPDYRLYPEVKFPQLMQDPALAVRWVKQHFAAQQGDADRLFLMGHSAGAHLAMMLSLNPEYLSQVGLAPDGIAGTIGLAGPYDFLPLSSDRLRAIFAPPDQEWLSQPIHFVHQSCPPLLLLTGLKDRTVWPKNSINLAHAVQRVGGKVSLKTYSDYDHIDIIAKLARPLRGRSQVLSEMADWMQAHGG